MFSETLKIIPKLDPGEAKKMERTLSERFARVAKGFGGGLKAVIKGSILGISLGLLSKLLNPLEALEEKIKNLLGEGTDIRDMADKFGSTPGELKRLQDVGQSLGVSPDQLKDMMNKFAGAVEKARTELEDPTAQISASTNVVKNFAGEKNIAEGFFQFLTSLKAQGQGQGRDVFFGEREQRLAAERLRTGEQLTPEERQNLISQKLLKHQSGLEARQANEREIFGEVQSGGARRLIEANFPQQLQKINEPSAQRLTGSINKVAGLADKQRELQVQNETKDFLAASDKLNAKMITDMAKAEELKNARETAQLASFDDLKKASLAIEAVKGQLENANVVINKGIGYLADIAGWVATLKDNRLVRAFGLMGGGGK